MDQYLLADTELYYSTSIDLKSQMIIVKGDESNHILNVMRHRIGDEILITNGAGKIFSCVIENISQENVISRIQRESSYTEKFPNITFCIPKLRSSDRFEFAIEKCTELGITNFIFFQAERAISKSFNQKRIEKILVSAMKQSLQSWCPRVRYNDSITEISLLPGEKIIFDQLAAHNFDSRNIKPEINYFFYFGPEGGFTHAELTILSESTKYKLAENRLRSETAIIKAASLLI
ncbi:MAG: 16S rRNA (uracil(1498)-N(3))-methyltransferase [Ignavibacteriaceae bacterium]|nr:16S rRNA (uracil(1498)-N(3))-methyltransferase [Ignavibacteriaceae bacterium]